MREKMNSIVKVRWKFERIDFIWLIITIVLAGVLRWTTGYKNWILPVFFALYMILATMRLEFSQKMGWIFAVAELAVGSWFTIWCVQYLILEDELFAKTSDLKWFMNVLVALALYCVLQMFTNRTALTCTIGHLLLLAGAFVDYFVFSFRGNELTFADLKAASTGLSVAANYQFSMGPRCGLVILVSILYLVAVWKANVSFQWKWRVRGGLLAAVVFCFAFDAIQTADTNTETWEKKGSYRNGFVLNFCLEIRDSIVLPPSGYSGEAIAEIEENYQGRSGDRSQSDAEDPTIIVIMSESYADLTNVGNFTTNVPLTPFYDSLTENTIKGYALSSVYSAKTANSEWEFMTGNSMAFMPQGSVVYQQFINDTPSSIVSTLKSEGYTCVSMHPYYETGWSRNKVYPNLGFEEMHFIDDFDQTKILRKYITDEEFYSKIIERYESSPDNEKLFIMGVSMQNHGGYGEEYDNMDQYVYKTGISYTDANQYLQLVHTSDEALETLITYFENVEDPVEIVFFGDHLPGLNSSFYQLLNGKGLSDLELDELEKLYSVPFFIWTNYDTEETTVDITSLNYLSTLALERANIDLPGYNQFLADMMEEIPAINSQGYYSLSKGGFEYLENAEGEEAEWINQYHMLQYNNMFDVKDRDSEFFPFWGDDQ